MVYEEAKTHCESRGATLARINSADENAKARATMDDVHDGARFWIDATDIEEQVS